MKIASLFSGAGGLDLGFEKAGFEIVWANEFDRDVWETYESNHGLSVDPRSIKDIESDEVPDVDGIIGGPPCQSWSEAGALRGVHDTRGQVFFDFIRILADKRPKFFLAENVSGMLHARYGPVLSHIRELFEKCGYNLSVELLNASDYGVPQDRKRVFFVGMRKDLNQRFEFPLPTTPVDKVVLRDAIYDLRDSAIPAGEGNKANYSKCLVPNHEYLTGGFSPIFMSRNRVRDWEEVSFTIQAGARHAPLHPQAPKMELVDTDVRRFVRGKESLYRRLSVRECARIQGFPDDFLFYYKTVGAGYKMIGNAVPVGLATVLANEIRDTVATSRPSEDIERSEGYVSGNTVRDVMLAIVNG